MLKASLLPLRSDRVVLRAMRREDAGAYAAGTSDPSVREYAHLPEPEYTEESVLALIEGPIKEGLASGDLAVLTMTVPSTDEFAGSLVLFGPTGTSIEVGFWVHPDYRGRGLSADALALAHDFARRSGFTTVTARTAPKNSASQRTLDRSGYLRSGSAPGTTPAGESMDLLHYRRPLEPPNPSGSTDLRENAVGQGDGSVSEPVTTAEARDQLPNPGSRDAQTHRAPHQQQNAAPTGRSTDRPPD
ncbi:GNAT family N-acetyltransferase [Nocardioidaceae bacterium SCSIO 66511]|nr:GNAT family N-acetyltransferase [Nocardioidaceae bacterium SCSIO 66511]